MAVSPVDICNSALAKLGAERIVTLEDNNKRARLCREQYPKLRDEVLASHPWNFAVTRKVLAKLAAQPPFEYDNMYALPSDVLRVIYTNMNVPFRSTKEISWQIESDPDTGLKVLLTNSDGDTLTDSESSGVAIKYIRQVTDTTVFSPLFDEALAWRIAVDLAYPIAQSTSLLQVMAAAFDGVIADARTYDAQEGSISVVEADELLDSRF